MAKNRLLIAASTLPPTESDLPAYIAELERVGIDMLHCDVMDGKFVSSATYNHALLKVLRDKTKLPFDVHLMVSEPAGDIAAYADAGADYITVHFEAFEDKQDLVSTLAAIHDAGLKAGISLKPKTAVSELVPYLELVDLVLVMSVEPGAGGQGMLDGSAERVAEFSRLREELWLGFVIEVDGGVNLNNVSAIRQAGADIVVIGSALYKAEDKSEFVKEVWSA